MPKKVNNNVVNIFIGLTAGCVFLSIRYGLQRPSPTPLQPIPVEKLSRPIESFSVPTPFTITVPSNSQTVPSSAPKPKLTAKPKPVPSSKPVRLLTTECGGVPYPTKTGYVKKCPALAIGGYSSVTVDNSQNDSDVFVKLFSLATTPPKAASAFFIRARDKFTVTDIQSGNYDVRYRDLTSKALSRTDQFNLKEVRTSTGVKFSRFTLTLYKVLDGNMHIQPISENEF
jgi:hypothetical protein